MDPASEKQRSAAGRREQRRADLALVTSYHEAQLAKLLERVQEGFRRFEAGEISAFELDDLIHNYKRAARELWKFCGDLSGSGFAPPRGRWRSSARRRLNRLVGAG